MHASTDESADEHMDGTDMPTPRSGEDNCSNISLLVALKIPRICSKDAAIKLQPAHWGQDRDTIEGVGGLARAP